MSSHKAGERGKTSSRRHKKRQSDGDRNQGPRPLESPNIITMAATDGDVLYGKSLSGSPDPDVTKSNLAKKVAALVHNQEPKEKLMDVIAHLVEENAVEEIEMLREEVQKLKGMLHDATEMLQHIAKDQHVPGVHTTGMETEIHGKDSNVDLWARVHREVQKQKKRLQEDHKREMDKLRQYFEKLCSQSQTDYVTEIYSLKLECQEVEQQRAEVAKLRYYCGEGEKNTKRLESENASIMREKVQYSEDIRQLQLTLMKMEKDKLTSEERTKKILSAVREGLHKLSDMKDGSPAEGSEPGLSSFYNHVEEIITTDNWGDDDIYTKGVMEEIQVSVQKLTKPSQTPERVVFEPRVKTEMNSIGSLTDLPPSTPTSEMEAVRLTYESRIATLEETAAREKCAQERTINDLNQQVLQLTQKNQANRIFIEELSQERDSEREEMLKVTKNLEDARRANEKLTETLTSLRQSSEDTENQLRVAAGQTEALESLRKQLAEDLQGKDDVLRQREELVAELERRLSQKQCEELEHHQRIECLKLELSGFLRSPPLSPEPDAEDSFTLDELRKQIMDLKDELEARNQRNEEERDRRISTLQDELDRVRKSEQRALRDRESFEQQIGNLEMDLAISRQQLDGTRFNVSSESMIEQMTLRSNSLQRATEEYQRTVEKQNSDLLRYRFEYESLQKNFEQVQEKFEQLKNEQLSEVRDEMVQQMENFEERNRFLVRQMEETAEIWDEQQRLWEDDLSKKSSEVLALKNELTEAQELKSDLKETRQELQEIRKRLEEAEETAREKIVQVQSLKNLVDIMKTESLQKDVAVKALQKQFNDKSASIARQMEEMEKTNTSLQLEVDVYREAPNRSAEFYDPFLREKDAEITRLRDLLESSFDESLKPARKVVDLAESSNNTDPGVFLSDIDGNTQTTEEATYHRASMISAGTQTEFSDEIQELLAQIADFNATIRELQHSIGVKENQMEAMAVELASLNDRHGKTQTKHRTTIRYLNHSGRSSSDEGSVNSMPRTTLNGETKALIAKYEGKIREMEKVHTDDIDRLVQESLSALQNQSMTLSGSIHEISQGNISMNSSTDSNVDESLLSDTLRKALKELRSGSEAILKASAQLNGTNGHKNGFDNWLSERELMLAKVSFFRETINQMVLSRDSMEKTITVLEQQNEELKTELEMLKREDQMADQGKDLLLALLKKTEAELAELHARYRQRDLRLEIEQAGREREEREREKLQKELRDTEVQLVRVRGDLRQKEAQWERERILNMWKKDSAGGNDVLEDANNRRLSWKAAYLRAESYRKNLCNQKKYLVLLIDDVILNTTDGFAKQLALDGVRPYINRGLVPAAGTVRAQDRRRPSLRSVAVVVCVVIKLRMTKLKWQHIRNYS